MKIDLKARKRNLELIRQTFDAPTMPKEEMKTELTHEQQLLLDLDLYGLAYERLLPDGSVERIDPKTIRVIRRDLNNEITIGIYDPVKPFIKF